ncbi:ABC transporter ATP-binding protein [Micromonospora auratinigra]|uniref:NitT/TauT family transport system ATP-binding protein n=1 Tax=Micromonospora auratinigra TaxID=261654 RepID=A0A1A8ZV60_9ACTN|nr:ABC transporter ATP-binding protein [Micromonospora auratinigra]SBT47721.1 NitT/TauT family transport system ATP-binding protein [Micromonospora auratinigra]
MIRLSGVSRIFDGRSGRVEALRGIDLDVAEGEFVAVLGRSGCGKSTLLRMIAGLLPASGGEITVAGTPITAPRRDIAMLFQRPALLPWRSVLDNVLLPVEIFGWSRRKHRDRARRLLEMAGLGGFEKRLPHELSGGMQQRVALCRSLIGDPRVMLMDEPFSALDALTREELSGELQRVHMETRATIVFVTHSIDEAVLLADRVVVLSPRPGRIREVVEVKVPRPRTLGRHEHLAEVARISAELHELLMERDAPVPAGTDAPAGAGTGGR